MALTIVLAQESDAEVLAKILSEASRYKAEYHNDYAWKDHKTGKTDYLPEHALSYINRGDTYLVYVDNAAAGTIALQRDDSSVWGPRLPNEAAYIHRLAIKDRYRGQNLGADIITWAELEAKSRGCRFLRLDVDSSNIGLRKYYERLGFKKISISNVPLRLKSAPKAVYKATLYERLVK